jgi:molecular chaperone DnaK
MQALSEASAALAQKLYAEPAGGAGQSGGDASAQPGGDTVDAEFEEVDDDKKK